MIPFDFVYLRPDTAAQAVQAHREFSLAGRTALYYAGGSEIISMSRVGAIRPDAVIDIKRVPECNALSADAEGLVIGAALSLHRIKESNCFPLLTLACGRIADHTNQCRITLGGNLCGTIAYRETCLPLLLSEASVSLYGPEGCRTVPFDAVFRGRMRLAPGELVVSVRVPAWAPGARHAHIKITANEKIDYPLVNVTALWKGDALRVAFSGLAENPLRSPAVEAALNDRRACAEDRAAAAARLLAGEAHGDAKGSKEYRLYVVKNALRQLVEDWEHGAL
ncbi:MAG: FAD-binding protein [Clostridiales bacterium]|nr:FAD-binding protein [Clostridiales bacterium]